MRRPSPVKYAHGYIVNFRHAGVRYQRRFPHAIHADPKAAAQAFIDSVIGETPEPEIESRGMAEHLRAYLNYSEQRGKKKQSTLRGDRTRLGILLRFCSQHKITRPDQINLKTFRKFQDYYFANAPFTKAPYHRKQRSDPNATWEKYRQISSAFFRWCQKRELMTGNPAGDGEFKTKPKSRVPIIYAIEDLAKLFDRFDQLDSDQPYPWLGAAFRFLAYTGARLGELLKCRRAQVDFKNNLVHLVNTKTNVDRSLVIHDKLKPFLERLPTNTELLFDNGLGAPRYTESGYWKILSRAMAKCEIDPTGRNVQTFRHTFCAYLLMEGAPIVTVQELMGHDNIETTVRYARHFAKGHKEAVLAKLPY